MSADEKGSLIRLIPEFYYDAIARLPAGAGAILFTGIALGVFPTWLTVVRSLKGPAVTFLLVVLIFAAYILGIIISGVAFFPAALLLRPIVWEIVKWKSKEYIDPNVMNVRCWSINREERKRYSEQKIGNPVLAKQRAEMALLTNLLTAAIASGALGLLACTLTGGKYWSAGILALLWVTLHRTYMYLEALMKPPPAASPRTASTGASTEAR